MVSCQYCEDETEMTETQLCDRCWELYSRIERDPNLALDILNDHIAQSRVTIDQIPSLRTLAEKMFISLFQLMLQTIEDRFGPDTRLTIRVGEDTSGLVAHRSGQCLYGFNFVIDLITRFYRIVL